LLLLQILQILSPTLFLPIVLLIIFTLGATKSFLRFRAVSSVLHTSPLDLIAHIFLWPFASLLYLYNAIAAGFSRRINWRGITYELKSPREAVIISRDS
jgi:uncharacterized membrane protein